MIGYDVKCYRCSGFEIGAEADEDSAREKVEHFKATHRSSCGQAASFSVGYADRGPDALLGVAYPQDVDYGHDVGDVTDAR